MQALACEQCPINLSTVATYLAAYRVPSLRFALGTANHEYRQALANCVATGAAGGAGEADGGGEATGGAGAGAGTEETGSAAVKAALWKRGVLHFMNGELVPALEDFLCRQRLFINCSCESETPCSGPPLPCGSTVFWPRLRETFDRLARR